MDGKLRKRKKLQARKMASIDESLKEIQKLSGFIAAAVGHAESGMAMGTIGGSSSFNIDVAVATNTEVVKAKLKAMQALKLGGNIEDMLITLDKQYHLIRPLTSNPAIFVYVALDRESANLAIARFKLAEIEKKINI
jgi:hypothetical protein